MANHLLFTVRISKSHILAHFIDWLFNVLQTLANQWLPNFHINIIYSDETVLLECWNIVLDQKRNIDILHVLNNEQLHFWEMTFSCSSKSLHWNVFVQFFECLNFLWKGSVLKISASCSHKRMKVIDNLGKNILAKFTRLDKINFPRECFTVDFLQFCQKIFSEWVAGYSPSIPSIVWVFLKLSNFLRS